YRRIGVFKGNLARHGARLGGFVASKVYPFNSDFIISVKCWFKGSSVIALSVRTFNYSLFTIRAGCCVSGRIVIALKGNDGFVCLSISRVVAVYLRDNHIANYRRIGVFKGNVARHGARLGGFVASKVYPFNSDFIISVKCWFKGSSVIALSVRTFNYSIFTIRAGCCVSGRIVIALKGNDGFVCLSISRVVAVYLRDNDIATSRRFAVSLHDALPICARLGGFVASKVYPFNSDFIISVKCWFKGSSVIAL